ncbi:STAS domain-containing protein [Labrys miyagiensis]|uniref:STAS domain-containing protein n=1 Tax=Labrys miyagiensis TaxID=346912 RepID=UPI0024E1602B|nr:STAS domain-containing protein [Labrys miyagiensis]
MTELHESLVKDQSAVITDWISGLKEIDAFAAGRTTESEARTQGSELLAEIAKALRSGDSDTQAENFSRVRELVRDMSQTRAVQGFSPGETVAFIFSFKRPIFDRLKRMKDADKLALAVETITTIVDELGIYSMEVFQKTREEIILRQQQEIAELSTPVVKLWNGIVALPLIGTLDSARTQVVMENLLESIVEQSAEIAIIDITGVPTVDTLVAQHLLKTVAAARLMGADCLISGIRPQIAQTMVHLGVELNVVSKASLADAFALALQRTGRTVVKMKI